MFALLLKGPQLFHSACRFWHKPRIARHLHNIQRIDTAIAFHNRLEQIFHMKNADNIIRIFAVDRNAGMAAGNGLFDDLIRRFIGVDHLNIFTVDHDLFNRKLTNFEHAVNLIAGAVTHPAFL